MGDTHWRSNLKARDGTEGISGFATIKGSAVTATTLTAGAVTSNTVTVNAGNYIQLGAHQYVFFGDETAEATIVAVATAVDASVKGSLYMSRGGVLWVFDGDTAATQLA